MLSHHFPSPFSPLFIKLAWVTLTSARGRLLVSIACWCGRGIAVIGCQSSFPHPIVENTLYVFIVIIVSLASKLSCRGWDNVLQGVRMSCVPAAISCILSLANLSPDSPWTLIFSSSVIPHRVSIFSCPQIICPCSSVGPLPVVEPSKVPTVSTLFLDVEEK